MGRSAAPPEGWKDELIKRWKVAPRNGAPPPQHRTAAADFAHETFDFD
ncbi:hypothetical protein [Streptomyces cyaneofuscatus]